MRFRNARNEKSEQPRRRRVRRLSQARGLVERKADEAALRVALEQMEARVTERAGELQRSNERLQAVVTNAPVILFSIDAAGVFTLSEGNGLAALGLAPGRMVGQSVFELYENSPEILLDVERGLAGETFSSVVTLGDLIFETHYSPHRDSQGQVTGIFGVSIDVTERARAAAALLQAKETAEAANRAKSQFLANVSHELRTPLNAIIGFSEILCDQTRGELNPKQARYAQNALASGRHLLNLINAILDLSKIEAGKMELEISEFLPAGAMREVLQVLSPLAAEKQITLTFSPAEDAPPLTADRNKFKQAFYNLVSNAVKFTPEQGQVEVKTKLRTSSVRGHFLEIAVADTGVGVRLEDYERIFAQFEQADASFARRQEGTGLGLALTRRIAELHGGTLSVQSDGEGLGSVFRFILPVDRGGREEEKGA